MDFFEKMKKKIRKTTGQDEPYARPKQDKKKEETRPGMFSEEEMDEMNEARKKHLQSLKSKRK